MHSPPRSSRKLKNYSTKSLQPRFLVCFTSRILLQLVLALARLSTAFCVLLTGFCHQRKCIQITFFFKFDQREKSSFPDPFTIMDVQKSSQGGPGLLKIRWSPDVETLKLWKSLSVLFPTSYVPLLLSFPLSSKLHNIAAGFFITRGFQWQSVSGIKSTKNPYVLSFRHTTRLGRGRTFFGNKLILWANKYSGICSITLAGIRG